MIFLGYHAVPLPQSNVTTNKFKIGIGLESSNCYSRFVVRSFFVGAVEQTHVTKVVEKFGGPKLKATIIELFKYSAFLLVPHRRRSMDREDRSRCHGRSMVGCKNRWGARTSKKGTGTTQL